MPHPSSIGITAKKYYSRTGMNGIEQGTMRFIVKIIETNEYLIELERRIITLTSPLFPINWPEFDELNQLYNSVTKTIENIQKAVNDPSANLTAVLHDNSTRVTSTVVSQVQTAFQKKPLSQLLSRLFSTHDRVGRMLSARRQERLTRLIVIASGAALLISLISVFITIASMI